MPHLYANFSAQGEEYVNARPHFDKAKVLVNEAIFAWFCVGNDASSHCTSNLTAENVHSVGRSYHHVGTFVLLAGFG